MSAWPSTADDRNLTTNEPINSLLCRLNKRSFTGDPCPKTDRPVSARKWPRRLLPYRLNERQLTAIGRPKATRPQSTNCVRHGEAYQPL
jgi:hypothetical protein